MQITTVDFSIGCDKKLSFSNSIPYEPLIKDKINKSQWNNYETKESPGVPLELNYNSHPDEYLNFIKNNKQNKKPNSDDTSKVDKFQIPKYKLKIVSPKNEKDILESFDLNDSIPELYSQLVKSIEKTKINEENQFEENDIKIFNSYNSKKNDKYKANHHLDHSNFSEKFESKKEANLLESEENESCFDIKKLNKITNVSLLVDMSEIKNENNNNNINCRNAIETESINVNCFNTPIPNPQSIIPNNINTRFCIHNLESFKNEKLNKCNKFNQTYFQIIQKEALNKNHDKEMSGNINFIRCYKIDEENNLKNNQEVNLFEYDEYENKKKEAFTNRLLYNFRNSKIYSLRNNKNKITSNKNNDGSKLIDYKDLKFLDETNKKNKNSYNTNTKNNSQSKVNNSNISKKNLVTENKNKVNSILLADGKDTHDCKKNNNRITEKETKNKLIPIQYPEKEKQENLNSIKLNLNEKFAKEGLMHSITENNRKKRNSSIHSFDDSKKNENDICSLENRNYPILNTEINLKSQIDFKKYQTENYEAVDPLNNLLIKKKSQETKLNAKPNNKKIIMKNIKSTYYDVLEKYKKLCNSHFEEKNKYYSTPYCNGLDKEEKPISSSNIKKFTTNYTPETIKTKLLKLIGSSGISIKLINVSL